MLERDTDAFMRATYINQARVHMGYHYPRSYSTAIKSANYFKRFCDDYSFCIMSSFEQVYAISAAYSWTNAEEFRRFCDNSNIRCDDVSPAKYFNKGVCDGAFLTTEYTYDAQLLKDYFLKELMRFENVIIRYSEQCVGASKKDNLWQIKTSKGETHETPFILNATYAGVNDVHELFDFEPFKIKYELCEIILCKVNDKLKDVGITVMDGPFFSIMPFGKTGYHSLTSVTFTPHKTSHNKTAQFECQRKSGGKCTNGSLYNCNECIAKPETAWPYMSQLAHKYLKDEYEFVYSHSLFSMKPILKNSEIDDSRPTVIREMCASPKFISVLSGKINTVYDLDEFL